MFNKNQVCCFTGHRDCPEAIKTVLKKTIVDKINAGVKYFGAGGALGFDTWAAECVLELKEEYDIYLVLVLPCRDQTKYWGEDEVNRYERIKKEADKVVYTSEYYCGGCMHKRNRHLVDNSGHCVCYCGHSWSGTEKTVRYAKEKGLEIINLFKDPYKNVKEY